MPTTRPETRWQRLSRDNTDEQGAGQAYQSMSSVGASDGIVARFSFESASELNAIRYKNGATQVDTLTFIRRQIC